MDMQGTPIGSTNQGMKNTTDPRAKEDPIKEGAGAVASDSLAAESAKSGGGFSENRDSNPQSVKGSNSTFANTDTSGATTLKPAQSASERDDTNASAGNTKFPESTGGQAEFPGGHNADGYYGGSTRAKQEMSYGSSSGEQETSSSTSGSAESGGRGSKTSSSAQGGSSSTGRETVTSGSSGQGGSSSSGRDTKTSSSSNNKDSSSHVDTAPGYVASVVAQPDQHTGKPHGKNLHDVTDTGFEDDSGKNVTSLDDVDSEDHPGRATVQDFQNRQAGTVGSGPRQGKLSGEGEYDALSGDTPA